MLGRRLRRRKKIAGGIIPPAVFILYIISSAKFPSFPLSFEAARTFGPLPFCHLTFPLKTSTLHLCFLLCLPAVIQQRTFCIVGIFIEHIQFGAAGVFGYRKNSCHIGQLYVGFPLQKVTEKLQISLFVFFRHEIPMENIIPFIQNKDKPRIHSRLINIVQDVPHGLILFHRNLRIFFFQVVPETLLDPFYILPVAGTALRTLIQADINDIVLVDMFFQQLSCPDSVLF